MGNWSPGNGSPGNWEREPDKFEKQLMGIAMGAICFRKLGGYVWELVRFICICSGFLGPHFWETDAREIGNVFVRKYFPAHFVWEIGPVIFGEIEA